MVSENILEERHKYETGDLHELLYRAREKQMAQLLLEMDDITFFKAERALFAQCAETQEAMLMELLQAAKYTEFGRKHDFSEIKTVKDFCKALPLSKWEDYKEYAPKLECGEEDILFPGKTQFFYTTSGTTGGLKYIPESKREKIARKAIMRARNTEMSMQLQKETVQRILLLINHFEAEKTSGGIGIGTASGRSGELISSQLKQALVYPPEMMDLYSGDELRYLILRCGLYFEDLKCVSGNNALVFREMIEFGCRHAQELILDIREGTCRYPLPETLMSLPQFTPNQQRAEELQKLYENNCFTPRYYWKELRMIGFWLGGSVGIYADSLKEYLPENTIFMDIGYGASEAKINIPIRPGTPTGVLSIFSSFFEFIPKTGGEPLLAHQLEDGEIYEIVVTTYGGLYRYCLKDLIKVDGFTGDTPNIFFVTKAADMANLASEKIPGVELSSEIRNIISEKGFLCKYVQVRTDSSRNRYELHIELRNGEVSEELATQMDQELQKHIFSYSLIRGMGVEPLAVRWMKCGWEEWLVKKYQKKSATASQVKIPVVVSDWDDEDWMINQ